ncbi:MAG: hypothetical protein K9J13_07630 [Saprospiraceae bacterium]|nr:hypothetical protein [Saprospiraceae bacterium]
MQGTNEIDTDDNDLYYGSEKKIKQDSLAYYETADFEILMESQKINRQLLNEDYKLNLEHFITDIHHIFEKHKTDYCLIISPLYGKYGINPEITELLDKTFGKSKIFDFSISDKYIYNIGGYYEPQHFRPWVAREMMREVYAN